MKIDLDLGYTRILIKEAEKANLLRNQIAYLLATAYWESAHTMRPVEEAYWVKNPATWRKKNLKYYPWYGRGFVQLTWEANYKKASDKLDVDLINNRELALDPNIAAKIIVVGMKEGWFTGKKLDDYITLQVSNFKAARHIINGSDKDDEIADVAKLYDEALKVMPHTDTHSPVHVVVDDPGVEEPEVKETSVRGSTGFLELLWSIFLLFTSKRT